MNKFKQMLLGAVGAIVTVLVGAVAVLAKTTQKATERAKAAEAEAEAEKKKSAVVAKTSSEVYGIKDKTSARVVDLLAVYSSAGDGAKEKEAVQTAGTTAQPAGGGATLESAPTQPHDQTPEVIAKPVTAKHDQQAPAESEGTTPDEVVNSWVRDWNRT